MNRIISYGPALVVLLATAVVLVAGPIALRSMHLAQLAASMQVADARLQGDNPLIAIDEATRAIADSTLPGTVNIEINGDLPFTVPEPDAKGDENKPDAQPQDEGRPDGLKPQRQQRSPRLPPFHPKLLPATGSGWMYDDLGHIVTNAHVVRDAARVRVELFDGRVSDAEVVGIDAPTDIAVIKVDPGTQFFPLRRAVGTPVHVGDHVFALGSPFGFKFTMSQGIVSGLGRSEAASFVGMMGGYTNFIQTDAAMNPGNSGGPLINVRGEVIGMSTAIANSRFEGAENGQNAGIGFAIPLETIDSVVKQLISSDTVLRGYLGVLLDRRNELDPEQAAKVGYFGRGVLVTEDPAPEQPSGKAGLKKGDIITNIDGRATPNGDVLRSIVSIHSPGDTIEITYWRDGSSHTTHAKLGAIFSSSRGARPVPHGDEMTIAQIREWVADQAKR